MRSETASQTKNVSIVILLAVAVLAGSANATLIVSYDFEGNYSNNGAGSVTGQPRGGASIVADPGGGLKASSNVLKLYGNDEYLKVGNDDIGGITSMITVAAWVKSDGTNWSDAGIVTRGYNWRLYVSGSSDGTIQCMDTQPQGSKVRGSVNINDGEWHHVAGVYDGTEYILYVDGVQDGPSIPAAGPIAQTTSHKLTIGAFERSGDVSKFYDGYIDEVRVYDEALDAAAIQALVPEPATIALLGLGSLLLRRRKD
ncbi:MAG: LamG domain-containing protein [Planctomycetota bacterium]